MENETMYPIVRRIISDFSPLLLDQVDKALKLSVTNFKRDLFPSIKEIDLAIPGAGFQHVIWVQHEPKFPFPGFDAIARPMKYLPTYLSSGMKFYTIARAVARESGGHVEECLKIFCSTLNPPIRGYRHLPLGTLAKRSEVIDSLGTDLGTSLSEFADTLINPAKHEYGTGSPKPIISFPNALGGYFASRILGYQLLKKAGVLEDYIKAINKAHSEGRVYYYPEDTDPGEYPAEWPLRNALLEL